MRTILDVARDVAGDDGREQCRAEDEPVEIAMKNTWCSATMTNDMVIYDKYVARPTAVRQRKSHTPTLHTSYLAVDLRDVRPLRPLTPFGRFCSRTPDLNRSRSGAIMGGTAIGAVPDWADSTSARRRPSLAVARSAPEGRERLLTSRRALVGLIGSGCVSRHSHSATRRT